MIWQVKNPASKKIMRNRMWANRREVSNNVIEQKNLSDAARLFYATVILTPTTGDYDILYLLIFCSTTGTLKKINKSEI